MLTELHVEHLGVIERATIELGEGMSALTGETGAGKTMLIEALELLVGGRADPAAVRHGSTEARVDGRFVVGDDEFVLSRVVPAHGRSRAYLDGRPVTAAELAERTGAIVDLHGQHAHQALLAPSAQRRALDEFGGVDVGEWERHRAEIARIDSALAALGGDPRARARDVDLLSYQVDEIDAARLDAVDEDERLAAEESVLADAVAHQEAAAIALAALTGDDGVAGEDGTGARELLGRAAAELAGRTPFAEAEGRLAGALAELDDIAIELRRLAEGIEEDPERLAEIGRRRHLLHDLRRKYGDTLAEVVAERDRLAARLDELRGHDAEVDRLTTARAAAVAAERAAAREVGAQRRATAASFGRTVQRRLRELGLGGARLVVECGDPAEDPAAESTHLLFTANPPNPPLPLHRVASGGELARTMLAIRLALVDSSPSGPPGTSTLVFDEVDAGIGGAAAIAVGSALAELGSRHQVLVVTHLAQVAAAASTQVRVVKSSTRAATSATVHVLDPDERVTEIARMLAGDAASDSARRHAAELLSSR